MCVLVWFYIHAKLRAHTLRHPCLAYISRNIIAIIKKQVNRIIM